MWPFNRNKKTSNPVTPTAVKEYYQAAGPEKMWLVWLASIATFIVTVLIVLGLFWGGRWVIDRFTDDEPKTATPSNEKPDNQGSDEQSQQRSQSSNSAPSGGSSNSTNNGATNSGGTSNSQSSGTSSGNPTATTTPTTGPSGGESLPRTGPDSDE